MDSNKWWIVALIAEIDFLVLCLLVAAFFGIFGIIILILPLILLGMTLSKKKEVYTVAKILFIIFSVVLIGNSILMLPLSILFMVKIGSSFSISDIIMFLLMLFALVILPVLGIIGFWKSKSLFLGTEKNSKESKLESKGDILAVMVLSFLLVLPSLFFLIIMILSLFRSANAPLSITSILLSILWIGAPIICFIGVLLNYRRNNQKGAIIALIAQIVAISAILFTIAM